MKIRQANTSLRKRKVCLACLMGLSIIQTIILCVMAVYWRMERNLNTNRYKTCLSMDKCPDGLEILNEESNKTICCGNVTKYFESLVSKSISKSYDSDSNPEIGVLNLKGFDCHAYDPKLVVLKLVGINRNETQGM
ncbi:uncharacterized protein LOC132754728 [Ruditapes philippinarum]|uniref:uncharacterized protein LOC132754728 n=1 Tax=Ruditapes philippinarum TaxID=129788 RepID=UPI00295C2B32|nr:uncharacterized protein LOC132754728 [Ruditapes philippinarum]